MERNASRADCKSVLWRVTGKEEEIDVSKVDVSMNGDRVAGSGVCCGDPGRAEPNSSVDKVLACYEVLDQLRRQLEG